MWSSGSSPTSCTTATLEIIGVLYTNRVIRYRAQTMHSHGIGAVKMTTLIVKGWLKNPGPPSNGEFLHMIVTELFKYRFM